MTVRGMADDLDAGLIQDVPSHGVHVGFVVHHQHMQGAGGQLIGNATYGPEYETARGQLKDLRAAAVEKNCNFVPGAETPATPASSHELR